MWGTVLNVGLFILNNIVLKIWPNLGERLINKFVNWVRFHVIGAKSKVDEKVAREESKSVDEDGKVTTPKDVAEELNRRNKPHQYMIARGEIGVQEKRGGKHNARILEYHKATSLKATDDETPWCSSFMNWCFMKARIPGTNSALARSWLEWGRGISKPYEGCVVVLKRGKPWQGHVGFFVRFSGEKVILVSGNVGDSVKESAFDREDIIGFREAA